VKGSDDSVTVNPVQFGSLEGSGSKSYSNGIELLLDVPLRISVELGRATKSIRDVLSLGAGSVIELDKMAGEPVDIMANDRLIARGEVVVVDENFGVRVTDIVTVEKRLNSLR
jgi:flagellar motor switch protein FliN